MTRLRGQGGQTEGYVIMAITSFTGLIDRQTWQVITNLGPLLVAQTKGQRYWVPLWSFSPFACNFGSKHTTKWPSHINYGFCCCSRGKSHQGYCVWWSTRVMITCRRWRRRRQRRSLRRRGLFPTPSITFH